MKKYLMPLALFLMVSAAIHAAFKIIIFLISGDFQIWNYFKMIELTYFLPSLGGSPWPQASIVLMAVIYFLLYTTYRDGKWKKYLR